MHKHTRGHKTNVGDGDKRLDFKFPTNCPHSNMKCGRFYCWIVWSANCAPSCAPSNASDKNQCNEHTNDRPWCHGKTLQVKMPRHIATNTHCAVASLQKWLILTWMQRPTQTPDKKVETWSAAGLLCAWNATSVHSRKWRNIVITTHNK